MSEYWPVPDVLAYLTGCWQVERTVRDLASGDEGCFEGTAEFTAEGGETDTGGPEGNGEGRPENRAEALLHFESGLFTWRGVPRPAERTLRWLSGSSPGTADVRFADGRPFHGIDLSGGRYVADHPCSADLYRGEFTVRDADHWRVVWRVRGPAKDLVLTTDHTRGPARRQSPQQGYSRSD